MKKSLKIMGFGLLELMLSLVIVALLLIMATRYYQSTVLNQKVNDALALVNSIAAASNTVHGIKNSYAQLLGDDKQLFLSSIPKSQKVGEVIKNPWGGDATVSAPSASNFTVTMNLVPADGCIKIKAYIETNSNIDNVSCSAATGNVSLVYRYNSTQVQ